MQLRKQLTGYLLTMLGLEVEGERLRVALLSNRFYQIHTVFDRLDKFEKGYLVPEDLSEFLLENSIYPSENQLYLIFRSFDTNRAGLITLKQLEQQLVPKENKLLVQEASQRKHYLGAPRLQLDLQFLLAKYLEHKIKEINTLSLLRRNMHEKGCYSADLAFQLLRGKQSRINGAAAIDRFLRANGKVLQSIQLDRIYRCFNREDAVDFDTFLEQFDPTVRGYYTNYTRRVIQKNSVHRMFLEQRYL